MSLMRIFQAAIGENDELMIVGKKWKQRWFDHVSWSSGFAKTTLQGTVKRKGRKRRRGGKKVLKSGQGWI